MPVGPLPFLPGARTGPDPEKLNLSTMRQALNHLTVPTRGKGFTEITAEVVRFVSESGIATGLLTIFCRHTSASLLIQENADPDVRTDLTSFFARIAPEGAFYVHDTEGPDDMPAHIRAALTQTSIGIPVERGRLVLGTWQGIYLFEHRSAPHHREIVLHVIGE
jgi:secondary thiamine-phosphate synthase enzyme